MHRIEVVGANHEVVFATSPVEHTEAKAAAAMLHIRQLNTVALAAGFKEWLDTTETLDPLGESVREALRIPFASPFMHELRTRANYPDGVNTERYTDWWAMNLGEPDPKEPYDTGVRLVNIQKVEDTEEQLRVPLDIVIPESFFAAHGGRPDRLSLKIGDRQLSEPGLLSGEPAQRLLLVASKFIEILKFEDQYRHPTGVGRERLA